MNDIGPVLLVVVCAAVVIGGGILLVAALGLLRVWAPKLLEVMGGAHAVFRSESKYDPATELSQRRRPNLREKADSLDFDAALARHHNEQAAPPTFDSQSAPPSKAAGSAYERKPGTPFEPISPPFDDDATSRQRRRKRRDRNQDELFGGMLDEDGDGDIDF